MFRFHNFKIGLRLFLSLYLFFIFFGAQIGNLIAKRNNQQFPRENMRILRGSQEIMSILGLIFHVTIELSLFQVR